MRFTAVAHSRPSNFLIGTFHDSRNGNNLTPFCQHILTGWAIDKPVCEEHGELAIRVLWPSTNLLVLSLIDNDFSIDRAILPTAHDVSLSIRSGSAFLLQLGILSL